MSAVRARRWRRGPEVGGLGGRRWAETAALAAEDVRGRAHAQRRSPQEISTAVRCSRRKYLGASSDQRGYTRKRCWQGGGFSRPRRAARFTRGLAPQCELRSRATPAALAALRCWCWRAASGPLLTGAALENTAAATRTPCPGDLRGREPRRPTCRSRAAPRPSRLLSLARRRVATQPCRPRRRARPASTRPSSRVGPAARRVACSPTVRAPPRRWHCSCDHMCVPGARAASLDSLLRGPLREPWIASAAPAALPMDDEAADIEAALRDIERASSAPATASETDENGDDGPPVMPEDPAVTAALSVPSGGPVPLSLQRACTVALLGPPNSGKSMLTNMLVNSKVRTHRRFASASRRAGLR